MKQPDTNENPTVLLRRLHRWRMAFFGLVILLAGIAIGSAGALLVFRTPQRRGPMPPDMAEQMLIGRFKDELGVTPEQEEQIRAILQTRLGKLEELREKARPQIEEQLAAMKKEISGVLTEDQRTRWQEMVSQMEREFRRGMRRGPGRPGGPPDGFPGGRDRFGPRDESGRPGERRPWERHRGPDSQMPPRGDEMNEPNQPDHPPSP